MTISQTIQSQWGDLSRRAQDHIRETRPQLLSRWRLYEDAYDYESIEADDAAEALEIARDNVSASNYDHTQETLFIEIRVVNEVTGESDSDDVALEPQAPECSEGTHDWQSPHSVLGGLKENPGVWGKGGGVIIREVCAHCGRYRVTDTWAQGPGGVQGLRSVRYEASDDDSRQWIEGRTLDAIREWMESDARIVSYDGDAESLIEVDVQPELLDEDGQARDLSAIQADMPQGWEIDYAYRGRGEDGEPRYSHLVSRT